VGVAPYELDQKISWGVGGIKEKKGEEEQTRTMKNLLFLKAQWKKRKSFVGKKNQREKTKATG